MSRPPRSRWERTVSTEGSDYAAHFAELVAAGTDVDGEARLADALVPRGARILDVGAGMGRVSAALRTRGHDVVGIEPDPALRAQSEATYPGPASVALDVLELDVDRVGGAPFDLAVCVGNVLVYLAEDTEVEALRRIGSVLAPGGRVLAGFHLVSARRGARDYAPEDFAADVAAAGLRVEYRFGGYSLEPPAEDYGVFVLAR